MSYDSMGNKALSSTQLGALRLESRRPIEVILKIDGVIIGRLLPPHRSKLVCRFSEAGGDDFVPWMLSLEQLENIFPRPLRVNLISDCLAVVFCHVAHDYLVNNVYGFGIHEGFCAGDAVD
jgi:hypothetical protein